MTMTPQEMQTILSRLDSQSEALVELRVLLTERTASIDDHEARLRRLERNGAVSQGDRNLDHATISGLSDTLDRHEDRITEVEAQIGRWSGWIAAAAAFGGVAGSGLFLFAQYLLGG